jgi:hypothetical protein
LKRGETKLPATTGSSSPAWRYAALACDESALSMALRQVEQGRLFVALVLVLLAQAQDFLEDFHIEALSLGLSEDFLLALIQHLDLFVDAFNALDDDDHASVATATSWSAT